MKPLIITVLLLFFCVRSGAARLVNSDCGSRDTGGS